MIEVLYSDNDVVEMRVSASNGTFSAAADVYAGYEAAANLAKEFTGFPESNKDVRSYELGTFDPKYAGGGVVLKLSSLDTLGHCCLAVRLRADPQKNHTVEANAQFSIKFEPASLDSFLLSLAKLGANVGARASLNAA